MKPTSFVLAAGSFWLALSLAAVAPPAVAQSGHVLNGIGPGGQAWSGAGMANPQDALTGLHCNPAAIVEMDELL